ncbi:histone-lysine N-methyltransferase suv420h1-like isoform x2 [Plakobranchus ocellatus]|uniref:Histone-lysine N-methyltransferase suv420h1-like isoform x2 n=1 Tax=Plakobranchus ocellatus TaxID=259542 RepID=A0AAV3Y3T1_9GAST|nr:histone-lysine N-methyltransferase suv420h1-like isoform x2 [Plakobranchus ocellatus]
MKGLFGGTVDSESALRNPGIPSAAGPSPPPVPWLDGLPESLRSLCCGLTIYKNTLSSQPYVTYEKLKALYNQDKKSARLKRSDVPTHVTGNISYKFASQEIQWYLKISIYDKLTMKEELHVLDEVHSGAANINVYQKTLISILRYTESLLIKFIIL